MDVSTQLLGLGFSKNEVAVYLSLLTHGASLAGVVARNTRLERTSTYAALYRLEKQGLVSVTFSTKRKVFSAASPSRIADVFRERESQALLLAPQLEKMARLAPSESIQKFSGLQGVKNVLLDIISTCKKNEEYQSLGLAGNLTKTLPTFAKIFVARRQEKRIKARVIVRPTHGDFVMSPLTQLRKLDIANDESISTLNINIYGNKVSLIIWTETPQAILIEQDAVAFAFRSYFELLWSQAKA